MEEMPSGNADVLLVIAIEIVDPTDHGYTSHAEKKPL
jgi:hypothetical protein